MNAKGLGLTVAASFLFFGCNTLRKIPGLGGANSEAPQQAAIPDDFTATGVTVADYQIVYFPTGSMYGRQIVAEVKRPGETEWHRLYVDPDYSYIKEYKVTSGPPSDSFWFRSNVIKESSQYRFVGPVAPIGTEYRIRSVRVTADKSLY